MKVELYTYMYRGMVCLKHGKERKVICTSPNHLERSGMFILAHTKNADNAVLRRLPGQGYKNAKVMKGFVLEHSKTSLGLSTESSQSGIF